MANPVELIGRARDRIARLAALRAALYPLAPAATALVLAVLLEPLGHLSWERLGYTLAPAHLTVAREACLGVAALALLLAGLLGWRAYRQAEDFIHAAALVDEAVGGHQEILTLGTLADPALPGQAQSARSSLFPMLLGRVGAYLERFDPDKAFRPEVGEPLRRSSLFAAAVAVALGVVMVALVRPPTLEQLMARRLKDIAHELAAAPNAPANRALINKVLAAASALENPSLPPEEKLKQVETAMRELDKRQDQANQSGSKQQSGSGNSGGKSQSGKGQGGGNGEGSGQGAGAGGGGQGKGGRPMIELKNELAKAKAEVQTSSGPRSASKPQASGQRGGQAAGEGNNPNQPGGAGNRPNPGSENIRPSPGASPSTESAGNQGTAQHARGGGGDTHLGQMPKAESFARYQPGAGGQPLAIKDARYVLFRLPSEIHATGGGGRTVADTGHPAARTPYTNVPLKTGRLDIAPEERQLVPPRYRDLIQ